MKKIHFRWIKEGNVMMLIGASLPAVTDVYFAGMTFAETFSTRIWVLIAKTLLGGIYQRIRDDLVQRLVDRSEATRGKIRLQVGFIDSCCYCTFNVSIYSVALLVQHVVNPEKALTGSMLGLLWTAGFTFCFGGVFGFLMDKLKEIRNTLK